MVFGFVVHIAYINRRYVITQDHNGKFWDDSCVSSNKHQRYALVHPKIRIGNFWVNSERFVYRLSDKISHCKSEIKWLYSPQRKLNTPEVPQRATHMHLGHFALLPTETILTIPASKNMKFHHQTTYSSRIFLTCLLRLSAQQESSR